MKTSIKIITVFSLLFCIACGAKRSTQSNIEKTQEDMATEGTDESQGQTSPENTTEDDGAMEQSSSSVQTKNKPGIGSLNDNSGDTTTAPSTEKTDNSEMYSKLKMTDGQVQDFENGLEDFDNRQKNMANGEMLGTTASEKERLLEDILSPEQYATYQSMK